MGVKRYTRIKDPRLVKKPLHAAIAFSKERYDSGDMKGIALAEASKLIQREWKDLTDAQKRVGFPWPMCNGCDVLMIIALLRDGVEGSPAVRARCQECLQSGYLDVARHYCFKGLGICSIG